MKSIGESILQITVGLATLLALTPLLAQTMFHVHILAVQTNSMRPGFSSGDALLVKRLTPQSVKMGMVVTYRSNRNRAELVTHRVVHVTPTGFQTQGDALASPDPPVHSSALVGQVIATAPGLGRVLNWLQTLPGLLCVLYIPAGGLVFYELMYMERSLKKLRVYRDAGCQVV